MTFSALKCIAQMLLFEIASFLVTLKTENRSYGTRIVLGHTLFFVVRELTRIRGSLQFANQH